MIVLRLRHLNGFLYLEILIAVLVISVALVPAMDALQGGIQSATIDQALLNQQYSRISKMEYLFSEPFSNLLSAAEAAGNKDNLTTYSDAPGTVNRCLVYLSLYDADADPFLLVDPNADGDNNLYTGSTANLIWLKVETEGASQSLQTLLKR